MNENEFIKLSDFLECFELKQKVRIVSDDNVVYDGTINDLTVKVINRAYVKDSGVFLDNDEIVISIKYES